MADSQTLIDAALPPPGWPEDCPSSSTASPRFRLRSQRGSINPYVERMTQDGGQTVLTAADVLDARDRWDEVFQRSAPLWLEIGPGNGFFLAEMANTYPQRNVLGLEIRYKRVWLCARKADGASNLRVGHFHAGFLPYAFRPGKLSGVWINHPDPWPKDRHEKNRLFQQPFVQILAVLVESGGTVEIRSDWFPHRDKTLELFPGAGFELTQATDNLELCSTWSEEARTNYQRKKTAAGLPVFAQRWVRS